MAAFYVGLCCMASNCLALVYCVICIGATSLSVPVTGVSVASSSGSSASSASNIVSVKGSPWVYESWT